MKIAVLNWRDLEHPDSGGAEVFVHEVGKRWMEAGHEVSLYSSAFRDSEPVAEIDGVRVVRVGRLRDGAHHLLAPQWLRSDQPDVVLESINTIPYLLPLRREFPPFVSLVHQLARDIWDVHLRARVLADAARALELQFLRPYRSRRVLAVSESTKSDLTDAGLSDVEVIPQGGLGRQPLREKEAVPTLIFVGRLVPNKRPDHAVEAFRLVREEIPEARLWMVGDGPMKKELLSAMPPGGTVLGKVSRAELLDRLGRAHVLVASSVREGWGLTVTEANALGTPAVAYDVPGLRDAIRPGRAGVLATANPRQLAKEVIKLLCSPREYERIRDEALAWGREHSWLSTASFVMMCIDDAVKER